MPKRPRKSKPSDPRCSTCGVRKPEEEFYFSIAGRSHACKECHRKANRDSYHLMRRRLRDGTIDQLNQERRQQYKEEAEAQRIAAAKRKEELRTATELSCKKCYSTKPRDEFSPDPRTASGASSWCKSCLRAYRKAWRAERARKLTDQKAKLKNPKIHQYKSAPGEVEILEREGVFWA